jgi:hypothetical protein
MRDPLTARNTAAPQAYLACAAKSVTWVTLKHNRTLREVIPIGPRQEFLEGSSIGGSTPGIGLPLRA